MCSGSFWIFLVPDPSTTRFISFEGCQQNAACTESGDNTKGRKEDGHTN